MFGFALKRIFGLIPIAFGVITLVALVSHIVPGNPVDAILGTYASEEERQILTAQLGLDKPIAEQLIDYFQKILHLDLGNSLITQASVAEMIAERFQATAELAVASILVAILLSIPLGILSALYAGTVIDLGAMLFALLGVAMPNFWLGSMLILVFSLHLDWFPVSERGGLLSYILPAITMGTALASVLSRMTRNSMLDTLSEDYVRTAKAKGCSPTSVVWKHTLRNAALPLITILGLQFGVVLAGAVITEVIFDWPGLGTLILEGVRTRDYPVIQGCLLTFSSIYLLVNLATDIIYAMIDPRIKIEGASS